MALARSLIKIKTIGLCLVFFCHIVLLAVTVTLFREFNGAEATATNALREFSVSTPFFLLLDVVPQVIFRTLLKLLNIVVISDLNSSVTGRHQNEAYLPWDWGKSQ